MSPEPNITQLLVAWTNGDQSAFERSAPAVHQQERRLAAHYLAGERPGHVLQTTALVNEAYIRLIDCKDVQWQSRAHFFGLAAQAMRRILVDDARSRLRAKRGGGEMHVSLSHAADVAIDKSADQVALDDALTTLEELNPLHSRVVAAVLRRAGSQGGRAGAGRVGRHSQARLVPGAGLALSRAESHRQRRLPSGVTERMGGTSRRFPTNERAIRLATRVNCGVSGPSPR